MVIADSVTAANDLRILMNTHEAARRKLLSVIDYITLRVELAEFLDVTFRHFRVIAA